MAFTARVLLAEDHSILRDGLRNLLESQGNDFEVVGEVDNGLDAIKSVQALKPDLLLLDISMPHSNGTDVLENIKQRVPQTKVIVLTQYQTEDYVRAALQAGAEGYFVKTDGFPKLLTAIRDVLEGHRYISARISHIVLEGYSSGGASAAQPTALANALTARQRSIIKLLKEGRKNQAIAETLAVSVSTVEKDRAAIMRTLSLPSTSALVAWAVEHGF